MINVPNGTNPKSVIHRLYGSQVEMTVRHGFLLPPHKCKVVDSEFLHTHEKKPLIAKQNVPWQ